MTWKKLNREQIRERVFSALKLNTDFENSTILGIPGSYLDPKVFYREAPFLKEAPFLTALIHNPNHIGIHTIGESESFFAGTQEIERELIKICSEDILNGEADAHDGYVASGGTEANIQAIWIYRNYFIKEHGAKPEEIGLICSTDSHYSMVKAANLLNINLMKVPVVPDNRSIEPNALAAMISEHKKKGVKYIIVVANMMTTMFGSVDDINMYSLALESADIPYKIHVDGAYGGFFYPFSGDENKLDFSNQKVSSVVLDAHKMVQAPYGTGIFLIRKGYIDYAFTEDASYVKGLDATLIGSRSGANAIAVWMILMTYGHHGWKEKIHILMYRTQWLCDQLKEMGIRYYRNDRSNIVTIYAEDISPETAEKYGLVPDNHDTPNWFKVVVMDHVNIDNLEKLVEDLRG